VPSQVALPLAGVVQGVHAEPQFTTSRLSAQAPLHMWKPGLHCQLHAIPSHVAVAYTGAGHAVHEAPQPSALVFATHALPHA